MPILRTARHTRIHVQHTHTHGAHRLNTFKSSTSVPSSLRVHKAQRCMHISITYYISTRSRPVLGRERARAAYMSNRDRDYDNRQRRWRQRWLYVRLDIGKSGARVCARASIRFVGIFIQFQSDYATLTTYSIDEDIAHHTTDQIVTNRIVFFFFVQRVTSSSSAAACAGLCDSNLLVRSVFSDILQFTLQHP